MRKTKPGIDGVHEADNLFHGSALKRRRTLILPRFLNETAFQLKGRAAEIDAAHKILLRWADLESAGHLDKNETALDDAFRQEVFGTALGYTPSSLSPNAFFYEKGFFIPGIGPPDGVLGHFPPVDADHIRGVLELKSAQADLDHDRFNGRTAVQQCWDYLNNLPACPWGIVSNFVSLRLYHRDKTQRVFEHFQLQRLRDPEEFTRFWAIFSRDGLLPGPGVKQSRVESLIHQSDNRQRQVGDQLYDYYSNQRILLIQHLIAHHQKTPDQALRAAQKLLDRIIFVAFCEDRGLLPHKLLADTWKNVAPLARVTNPRWRNFVDMFHAIDKGHPSLDLPTGYNGGLFADDPNVDQLELEDNWTTIFNEIGKYDFAEDVNVDVLGHLFEKSVSEIEKIRIGGVLFTGISSEQSEAGGAMPRSAERKRFGIYYTPPAFTRFIVERTIGAVITGRFAALAARHGVDAEQSLRGGPSKQFADYWRDCWDCLRGLTVIDPACGSGAFLIAAYELLEEEYQTVAEHLAHHTRRPASTLAAAIAQTILSDNLHGVDLNPEAVEITQLALWIRSAQKGRPLDNLSRNIVCANSLIADPAIHPRAMDWRQTFASIFEPAGATGGFTCVIGNPPWERLKLQEREFFAFSRPDIAGAVNAAQRRKLIAQLQTTHPALYDEYEQAKAAAERTLNHVRQCGAFPLTARGDINTYMVFAELAQKIVAPDGRVGLLVPSGIATDDTTKAFFNGLMQAQTLIALYDFENKQGIFPDVDGRFKFSILLMGGSAHTTPQAEFSFFAHDMRDLSKPNRLIELSNRDLALLNPNTHTCPIFRTRRDAELTKAIYRRVPILVDENRAAGGNPWGVRFVRMFDHDTAAELFQSADILLKAGAKLEGNRWKNGKKIYLPLYEAKMVQAYDHRAASVVREEGNWVRQGQTVVTTQVEHQNPEFRVSPRWWVEETEVRTVMRDQIQPGYLAYKDVTSPTNRRTMIAAFVPFSAYLHPVPLILTRFSGDVRRECCLLANLNSLALDFVARQKVGGLHLSYFILNQIPTLPPDTYADPCPWDKSQTLETWISERVLKLTCTANDMQPLAAAAGFAQGVHKWKENERAALRAQLDAAYFHLYGLTRDNAQYILSTFQGMTDKEEGPLAPTPAASAILAAYDELAEA